MPEPSVNNHKKGTISLPLLIRNEAIAAVISVAIVVLMLWILSRGMKSLHANPDGWFIVGHGSGWALAGLTIASFIANIFTIIAISFSVVILMQCVLAVIAIIAKRRKAHKKK